MVTKWFPYDLVGLALLLGPVVRPFEPFPWPSFTLLVGGTLLAVAGGSVIVLIARHGGPDDRRPDKDRGKSVSSVDGPPER